MDLDTLLRDTSAIAPPTGRALDDGRTRLDDEVRRATRTQVVRIRDRRRLRRPLLVGLVAGAAAVALVVGPTVDVGGVRPSVSAQAAQVLVAAGRAAGTQPGDWQDARFWHSVSSYSRGGQEVRREIWIGHREPGVLRDGGVDTGVIPLDIALFATGGTSVDWDGLWELPTEPAALERRLRDGIQGAGPDDDSELFVIVGDLLRESPAPPALRRALWEVAARVPGVELLGPTRDQADREGVAVRRGETTYVLDPEDGRLLQEESGSPDRPQTVQRDDAGRVVGVQNHYSRTTYLEQGPSASAPAVTNRGAKEQRG